MTGSVIVVCGSVASDHLMRFPGRFAEQFLAEELDKVSLSFLVESLDIRQGGVGANICHGLALLGARPLLVAAVGADYAEHAAELAGLGVDLSGVRVSPQRHTARFVCTTDQDANQIAAFYPGAMVEAAAIDLAGVLADLDAAMVLIGADEPEAMVRHARACRAAGVPFAADPSQQLARLSGSHIRELIEGAAYLFGNEYEHELLCRHTGWSTAQVLDRVGVWLTTLGARGVRIQRAGADPVLIPAVPATGVVDPTGGGDAFRAGFLAGHGWGWPIAQSAQLGCALATAAIEHQGGQGYRLDPEAFAARLGATYGAAAAERLAAARDVARTGSGAHTEVER
jgi:adenosine kinase